MKFKKNLLFPVLALAISINAYAADKKIRFIGYAIPTTPTNLTPVGNVNGKGSTAGYFVGNSYTNVDLSNRVNILINAVKTAENQINAQVGDQSNVINVFMVPEFFFHGIYGPYLWNSSYENDPLIVLQTYLKSELSQYKNWIFVAGSILTIDSNKNIDSLLADYKYKNDSVNNLYEDYISLMKQGRYNEGSVKAKEIQDFVQKSHGSSDVKVKNRTVIIDNTQYTQIISSEKEFISNEDLPLVSTDSNYKVITEQMSAYPNINLTNGDVKSQPNDPYSIFTTYQDQTLPGGNINIGMDICLDHSNNRLRKNLDLNNNTLKSLGLNPLHIQLIPSAGMQIHADGVSVDKNGLVFNVDGEYGLVSTTGVNSLYLNYSGATTTIPYKSPDYPDARYTYAAHSQLARVATPAIGSTPGTNNASFSSTLAQEVDTVKVQVTPLENMKNYYTGGTGELHIYGLKYPMLIN